MKIVSYIELDLEKLAMIQAAYIYKSQFRNNFSTYMYYMGRSLVSPRASEQDLYENLGFHM